MFLNLGDLLCKSWGTSLLADPNMFGFMVVAQVPNDVLPPDKSDSSAQMEKPSYTDKHAEILQDILHHDFRVEVHGMLVVD